MLTFFLQFIACNLNRLQETVGLYNERVYYDPLINNVVSASEVDDCSQKKRESYIFRDRLSYIWFDETQTKRGQNSSKSSRTVVQLCQSLIELHDEHFYTISQFNDEVLAHLYEITNTDIQKPIDMVIRTLFGVILTAVSTNSPTYIVTIY